MRLAPERWQQSLSGLGWRGCIGAVRYSTHWTAWMLLRRFEGPGLGLLYGTAAGQMPPQGPRRMARVM